MKIEVKNISKKYQNREVLKDVSFTIEKGAICGLFGMNGVGKSTLMKIIYGIEIPDKGQVLFEGHGKTSNIGALIEQPPIYSNLSAFDNLKTKALLYDIPNNQIKDILKRVGLDSTDKKHVGKFSVGMKQRLGIGMAILTQPKFIILDEPTNGLDPDGVIEFLDLLKSLKKQGVTILISSHQLHEIGRIVDQVIILDKGHVVYNKIQSNYKDIEEIFFNVMKGESFI